VGLVNAVLRKVATASWSDWTKRLAPADEIGATAFAHGYPRWVAAAISEALGDDAGELAAALSEDRPVTHLVARPGRITRDELLAESPPGATAGPWSPYAVRLAGGNPATLPAVRAGKAAVQDEGSQLVTLALTRVPVEPPDTRWLDTCAGPGGKSALLAGLMPDGGRLLAGEVSPARARLVRSALADAAGTVIVADGSTPAWRPAVFDRVLVDAPCTGLGALRRRPEVRWRRQPGDVQGLVELQRRLLGAAIDAVRPGGVVAYVTCSPHLAETRGVVDHVQARLPHVSRLDAREFLAGVPQLGTGPDVQLWPHRHGTDAMYLALLRSGYRSEPSEP